MIVELKIDSPKFQVGACVLLHHPMYLKNTWGVITQIRCSVTIFTVKSPPEFMTTETRYVYFLHNIPDTFFAEADLEYIPAEMAPEYDRKNKGL